MPSHRTRRRPGPRGSGQVVSTRSDPEVRLWKPATGEPMYSRRTYTEPALWHGYRANDLREAARIAAAASTFLGGQDLWDRFDWALSGIAVFLAAEPETELWPWTRNDLISVGRTAISREYETNNRHHGKYAGAGTGSRFRLYWRTQRHPQSPEGPIVRKISVWQVVAVLTPRQQEMCRLFSMGVTKMEVGPALGISRPTVTVEVRQIREVFDLLWIGGVVTRRRSSDGVTCRAGHPWTDKTRYCSRCRAQSQRRQQQAKGTLGMRAMRAEF